VLEAKQARKDKAEKEKAEGLEKRVTETALARSAAALSSRQLQQAKPTCRSASCSNTASFSQDGSSGCIATLCGNCCTDARCTWHIAAATRSAARRVKMEKKVTVQAQRSKNKLEKRGGKSADGEPSVELCVKVADLVHQHDSQ